MSNMLYKKSPGFGDLKTHGLLVHAGHFGALGLIQVENALLGYFLLRHDYRDNHDAFKV
jgi:hypothetical protein